jgi:hypothetical protein
MTSRIRFLFDGNHLSNTDDFHLPSPSGIFPQKSINLKQTFEALLNPSYLD